MHHVGIVGDHYLLFWLYARLFDVNCALSKKNVFWIKKFIGYHFLKPPSVSSLALTFS
jgi:hypothetical protein